MEKKEAWIEKHVKDIGKLAKRLAKIILPMISPQFVASTRRHTCLLSSRDLILQGGTSSGVYCTRCYSHRPNVQHFGFLQVGKQLVSAVAVSFQAESQKKDAEMKKKDSRVKWHDVVRPYSSR